MIIYSKLKKLRLQLEKTQQQIASELHVEQSTYSRYESGKTRLPLEIIEHFAEKYNIDPQDFFDFKKGKITKK